MMRLGFTYLRIYTAHLNIFRNIVAYILMLFLVYELKNHNYYNGADFNALTFFLWNVLHNASQATNVFQVDTSSKSTKFIWGIFCGLLYYILFGTFLKLFFVL